MRREKGVRGRGRGVRGEKVKGEGRGVRVEQRRSGVEAEVVCHIHVRSLSDISTPLTAQPGDKFITIHQHRTKIIIWLDNQWA